MCLICLMLIIGCQSCPLTGYDIMDKNVVMCCHILVEYYVISVEPGSVLICTFIGYLDLGPYVKIHIIDVEVIGSIIIPDHDIIKNIWVLLICIIQVQSGAYPRYDVH